MANNIINIPISIKRDCNRDLFENALMIPIEPDSRELRGIIDIFYKYQKADEYVD